MNTSFENIFVGILLWLGR